MTQVSYIRDEIKLEQSMDDMVFNALWLYGKPVTRWELLSYLPDNFTEKLVYKSLKRLVRSGRVSSQRYQQHTTPLGYTESTTLYSPSKNEPNHDRKPVANQPEDTEKSFW